MQNQEKRKISKSPMPKDKQLNIKATVKQKKKKLATGLINTFQQLQNQRHPSHKIVNNEMVNQKILEKNDMESENQGKIEKIEYTPKTLRRVQKQGKYSSLQTLSMDLLRRESLYDQSKLFAQKIGINQHKNYFITAMRLSLLYHHKVCKRNQTIQKVIDEIFQYIQHQLKTCVQRKYDNKKLINLTIQKNKNDINVFKKVFQSDLSDFNNVYQLIKGLYDCKNNGEHSQVHKKNAYKLARIIMGVAKDGSKCSEIADPCKKLVPQLISCILSMNKKTDKDEFSYPVYDAKPETSNEMQEQKYNFEELVSQSSHNVLTFQSILQELDKEQEQNLQKQQLSHQQSNIDEQFYSSGIKRINDATDDYLNSICNNLEMRSPLTPLTPS